MLSFIFKLENKDAYASKKQEMGGIALMKFIPTWIEPQTGKVALLRAKYATCKINDYHILGRQINIVNRCLYASSQICITYEYQTVLHISKEVHAYTPSKETMIRYDRFHS